MITQASELELLQALFPDDYATPSPTVPEPMYGYMVTMVHQVTNEERFIYVWAWEEGHHSFLDALRAQRIALGMVGWDCLDALPLDTPF